MSYTRLCGILVRNEERPPLCGRLFNTAPESSPFDVIRAPSDVHYVSTNVGVHAIDPQDLAFYLGFDQCDGGLGLQLGSVGSGLILMPFEIESNNVLTCTTVLLSGR